ncbi:MFS Git1p-related glycerophosphoinositol permease [Panaeolus papilionaceus]|nr:MFS Git1p-related glycerophosphoinositol permease [Panaeolus papilionaceus]
MLNRDASDESRKLLLSPYFTILAAGFGFLSDGYQNTLMTMGNVVFRKLYPREYTSSVSTRVSNASLVGTIIGQILVGILCDRVGRKSALVLTTALIVLGATLATAAHGANGSVSGLFWFLTVARGITGVGVGGEYPAGSTTASESANERWAEHRGPVFIMATHFLLVLGSPLAISVFLIALLAAGNDNLTAVWRASFGVGIALPLVVFYFRLRMVSSKLYKEGAIRRRVPYVLVIKRYWKQLLGTCGAWFLFDFITFPNSIFSASIISNVIHNGDLKRTAEFQLLLTSLALPGTILGAFLCNPFGRRRTMMLGFAGYMVFGLILGLAYDKITQIIPLFVVMVLFQCEVSNSRYGLMQSVGHMGPGDMMGLVSAESYPTSIRGTCYGLSAAFGKLGAAVGTQVFKPIQEHLGKKWTFIIAAICGTAGIIVTYFLIPDLTGIDLADEDEKFMQYLSDNGWTGRVGEENEALRDDDDASASKDSI